MKFALTLARKAPENAPILLRGNLADGIRTAGDLGYDAVELYLRKAGEVDLPDLQEHCSKNGLAVAAIGTGGSYVYDRLSLTDADQAVREQCTARLCEFVDLGAVLGAKIIIGSARGSIPVISDYDRYEQYCLDGLRRVAAYATQKNVTLVLEAINRYETNFLNTANETLEFIKKTGSPSIGLHLDTFHMNIEEASIVESIAHSEALLGHVHFADSNRHYPRAGHIDFGAVIKALINIGYDGYIAFECLPKPDAITAAKNALSHVRALITENAGK